MIYVNFNINGDKYYLESSDSGKITLKINEIEQNKVSSKLKLIINELELDIHFLFNTGTEKNTRQLGKEIILNLDYNQVDDIIYKRKDNMNVMDFSSKEIEKGEILLKGNFTWNRIFINDINYEFNQGFNMKNNNKYIYRWFISKEEERTIFYIGETKQFSKRMNQYLKPGKDQKTNIRIKDDFNKLIIEGYTIYLDILNLENVLLEENTLESLDLKEYRRMFENYFIIRAKKMNFEVLNK